MHLGQIEFKAQRESMGEESSKYHESCDVYDDAPLKVSCSAPRRLVV